LERIEEVKLEETGRGRVPNTAAMLLLLLAYSAI
jgi:hypothetical protein